MAVSGGSQTPPQGHYAQANGLSIYYQTHGEGEPLLLLHGGSVTSQVWEPYVPALSGHFHLVIPDSRGHGRTDNQPVSSATR